MEIQQFTNVSYIEDVECGCMPVCEVSLIARPGEVYNDPSEWNLRHPRELKATDYIYRLSSYHYGNAIHGTAEQIVKECEGRIMCEFSKEQNRHIFKYRPCVRVHFLDGTQQAIYFDSADDAINFINVQNQK